MTDRRSLFSTYTGDKHYFCACCELQTAPGDIVGFTAQPQRERMPICRDCVKGMAAQLRMNDMASAPAIEKPAAEIPVADLRLEQFMTNPPKPGCFHVQVDGKSIAILELRKVIAAAQTLAETSPAPESEQQPNHVVAQFTHITPDLHKSTIISGPREFVRDQMTDYQIELKLRQHLG